MSELEKAIETLEDAAQLEGSEMGEFWSALVDLQRRCYLADSSKLADELAAEIKRQAEVVRSDFRVVTESIHREPLTVKRLVHYSEETDE